MSKIVRRSGTLYAVVMGLVVVVVVVVGGERGVT